MSRWLLEQRFTSGYLLPTSDLNVGLSRMRAALLFMQRQGYQAIDGRAVISKMR
jgi:hypothetical protein